MFEQLKGEYDAWVKSEYIKLFEGEPDYERLVLLL